MLWGRRASALPEDRSVRVCEDLRTGGLDGQYQSLVPEPGKGTCFYVQQSQCGGRVEGFLVLF